MFRPERSPRRRETKLFARNVCMFRSKQTPGRRTPSGKPSPENPSWCRALLEPANHNLSATWLLMLWHREEKCSSSVRKERPSTWCTAVSRKLIWTTSSDWYMTFATTEGKSLPRSHGKSIGSTTTGHVTEAWISSTWSAGSCSCVGESIRSLKSWKSSGVCCTMIQNARSEERRVGKEWKEQGGGREEEKKYVT